MTEPWRVGVREDVAIAIEDLLRATETLTVRDWPKDLTPVVEAINTLARAYLLTDSR